MFYFLPILLFVLGLIFGSFLNVLICRYRPERNIFSFQNTNGRSHCPYCRKTLSPKELVPLLSFFFQRGRCRDCGHSLSFQYPFIELLCGILFWATPLFFAKFYSAAVFSGQFLASPFLFYALIAIWLTALLIFILIAAIDIGHYLIPNELNIALAIFGFLNIFLVLAIGKNLPPFNFSFLKEYSLLLFFTQNIILNHFLGAIFGFLFFWLVVTLSRGRAMGFGDVKLAAASGLLFGWPDTGLIIVLSFIFGGIWGAYLLLRHKKKMRDKLPFAPFFVFAVFLTLFFGREIIHFYFRLFGMS